MKFTEKEIDGRLWIYCKGANRASLEEWGTIEEAQKSLLSLVDCTDCTDCKDCKGCRGCYNCTNCTDSRYLNKCNECIFCKDCNDSANCFSCKYCYTCTGCENCSYCHNCTNCKECAKCDDCTACTNCVRLLKVKNKTDTDSDVPAISNIHQKIYEAVKEPGNLTMGTWHACETTHCRAGWVVVLAGKAGKRLEKRIGTAHAAQRIYKASGYRIDPARFYQSYTPAMEDIARLAELEAAGKAPAKDLTCGALATWS